MRHRRFLGALGFAASTLGVAACGGGGGGTPPTANTPVPQSTPAAQKQQPVTASSGGTISASIPNGGSLSVQLPSNSLSSNATVTIYAYTSLAQLSSAKIVRRANTASVTVPNGGIFLGGFAIDTGSATVLKALQVTETLQGSVPSGDVLRIARLGSSGYTDVDTATASSGNGTNDVNKSYVSVSGGGTAAPYMIYAVPQASAATPAPIVIAATAAANQQIVIGGTGTFTVAGADKNGNPLPFVPALDTDNHAIATAAAGSTPFTANVTAASQGGVVNLLMTDARTGITGKTAFTVYTQRPSNAGNTFAFSGTLNQADTYAYPSPTLPPTNVTANITQNVKVSATANPYTPGASAQDFNVVEADAYPTQTFKTTTDMYYQLGAAQSGSSPFDLLGYNAVDDAGNTTAVQYASPQIVDELPEASGQTWSNSPAMTLTQVFTGLENASRKVNADGSYTDTETIYGSSGSDGFPQTTAMLQQNADGSASYTQVYQYTGGIYGSWGYTSQTISYFASAPQPMPSATPAISLSFSDSTVQATPAPSPVPQVYGQVGAWYSLPLYKESDKNLGSATFPQNCSVPAAFGSSGDKIQQSIQSVDTALGTLETLTTTQYVVTGFGPVCVQISDVTKAFYDFNNDTQYAYQPIYSETPLHTTTISETLTLQSSGTSTSPQTVRRADAVTPVGAHAIASGRIHVQLLAQRNRAQRIRQFAQHLYKAALRGGLRK